MDRHQLEFRKRHAAPIDRCLALVELALIEQAGDKAAAAIINCLKEIAHRDSGKIDGESLYDLGLGLRTVNGLEEAGIFSVSQLVESTAIELLQIPGFGASTLASVESGLSVRGMRLKASQRPPSTPGRTPIGDSISGDAELAKYKTGLTSYEKQQNVAGGVGGVKSNEGIEPCKTHPAIKGPTVLPVLADSIGKFPHKGERLRKWQRARERNREKAKRIAAKLEARKRVTR